MSEINAEDDMITEEPPSAPISADDATKPPKKEKKKKKKHRTDEEKEERRKKKKAKKNTVSPEPPEKIPTIPPVITVERPSITDAPVEPVPDQIIVSPNEEDPLPVDDDKKDENVKLVSVIDETVPELSAELDIVPTAVAVEASIVNDDEEVLDSKRPAELVSVVDERAPESSAELDNQDKTEVEVLSGNQINVSDPVESVVEREKTVEIENEPITESPVDIPSSPTADHPAKSIDESTDHAVVSATDLADNMNDAASLSPPIATKKPKKNQVTPITSPIASPPPTSAASKTKTKKNQIVPFDMVTDAERPTSAQSARVHTNTELFSTNQRTTTNLSVTAIENWRRPEWMPSDLADQLNTPLSLENGVDKADEDEESSGTTGLELTIIDYH